MNFIEPQVFLVAETKVIRGEEGVDGLLKFLGVPNWQSDAASDAELLSEIAGKLCYLSFSTDLNKNLTKVGTRTNHEYLQNGIIATKHGSVLEHPSVSVVFANVSRVLTHEMVRHRPGAAYSQVSGRYVRTDEIDMYLPSCIKENEAAVNVFKRAGEQMEENILELARIYNIDNMKTQAEFSLKKILTSAFRRIIGNGQANHIMATYNHRSLRHIIEMRTSQHAEEEIRVVFLELYEKLKNRYSAIYGDARYTEDINGLPEVIFQHSKV